MSWSPIARYVPPAVYNENTANVNTAPTHNKTTMPESKITGLADIVEKVSSVVKMIFNYFSRCFKGTEIKYDYTVSTYNYDDVATAPKRIDSYKTDEFERTPPSESNKNKSLHYYNHI
jgi:hypothetical protein